MIPINTDTENLETVELLLPKSLLILVFLFATETPISVASLARSIASYFHHLRLEKRFQSLSSRLAEANLRVLSSDYHF